MFDAVTFVGAGHALRRTAWDACGGYDEALFFCWEEFDFCLRAIALDWRIGYRGDIVIRHKVCRERRFAWSGTRWFYFVRNRLYIERKWGRSWLRLAPRVAGYLLKGARNAALLQTVHALWAAIRLSTGVHPSCLSPSAQAYLQVADAAHRGSLLLRLRREAFAMLPIVHSARP
jgi:GT2 family glycosyltransferase